VAHRADGGLDQCENPGAPPQEQTTTEAAQFLHLFQVTLQAPDIERLSKTAHFLKKGLTPLSFAILYSLSWTKGQHSVCWP